MATFTLADGTKYNSAAEMAAAAAAQKAAASVATPAPVANARAANSIYAAAPVVTSTPIVEPISQQPTAVTPASLATLSAGVAGGSQNVTAPQINTVASTPAIDQQYTPVSNSTIANAQAFLANNPNATPAQRANAQSIIASQTYYANQAVNAPSDVLTSLNNTASQAAKTANDASFTPVALYNPNGSGASTIANTQSALDSYTSQGWSAAPIPKLSTPTAQTPAVTVPTVTPPAASTPATSTISPPPTAPTPTPTPVSTVSADGLTKDYFDTKMGQFTSDNQAAMTRNNQSVLAGNMDAFKNFAIPTSQQNGTNLGNYNDNRNSSADQWWSQYVTGRR